MFVINPSEIHRHIDQGYNELLSVGVQRELPWKMFTSVSYVHSHDLHLPAVELAPQLPGATMKTAPMGFFLPKSAISSLNSIGNAPAGPAFRSSRPYDKITKYIPESPAAWRDVTVRQLLTHTSGIPDYVGEFDGKGLVDLQKNYTEDEVIHIVARQPLDFQPGEKRVYSNSGYVILGALIRHVTGKNWAHFLQERIFGPSGMTSTRVISEADIIPNRTSGYHLVNGQWKNTDWVAPSLNTLADGTLYTNVLDLAKWDEALSTEQDSEAIHHRSNVDSDQAQ